MNIKNSGKYFNTGIDPSNGFKMDLEVDADKRKVAEEIKSLAKTVDTIFLMTDPDREGEVIAWSLLELLKLPKTKCKRATTHEITPKAVVAAIENASGLNLNLAYSGITRSQEDKFIGYGLSGLARNFVGAKSIGRCQSIGLKLVADRENEIINFKPEAYYDLYLAFEKNKTKFKAKYVGTDTNPIEHLKTEDDVLVVRSQCNNNAYVVKNIARREKQESPKPPFCTATFQQEAANKLGLKVKDSQACAQKLFEGGWATYLRTDDTTMSDEFIPVLKEFIESNYGKKYYTKPRVGKTGETAQAGHECFRVTDPNLTPEKAVSVIKNDLLVKVYKLIWQRTIAAAMPNAVISETTYNIYNNNHKFTLVSNELLSPGYKEVYNYTDDKEEDGPIKETFTEGENLTNVELVDQKKQTTPRPRYTEASLIKELQKREIGRPSTYATIVETILSTTRGYAELVDKKITPTQKGMQLAAYCDRNLAEIINLDYTKHMEESLDAIAEGTLVWTDVMSDFYNKLVNVIKSVGETGLVSDLPDKKCPNCGADMIVRRSKFGKLFYGCSKFPKCKGIINVD